MVSLRHFAAALVSFALAASTLGQATPPRSAPGPNGGPGPDPGAVANAPGLGEIPIGELFVPPELAAVPAAAHVEQAIVQEIRLQGTGRPLTEAVAFSRAADLAVKANLIDLELALLDLPPDVHPKHFLKKRDKHDPKKDVKRMILASMAASARADAVLQAEELFFNLGGTEARIELLARSALALDQVIEETQRREELGLKIDVAPAELRQERAGVLKNGATLRATLEKLSDQLAALVQWDEARDPLRPVIDWEVRPQVVDEEAIVARGMSASPELVLLDYLATRMDAETVKTVEDFMPILQPLLTMSQDSPSSPCKVILLFLFPRPPDERRIEVRRQQLLLYKAGKEREAATRIRNAVDDMRAAERRLAFAKEERAQARRRLEDVEKKLRENLVAPDAVLAARMQLLRVEDSVVAALVDWYVARAKLRHAAGAAGAGL